MESICKLENWYQPDQPVTGSRRDLVLTGVVYNHHSFKDGMLVTTSKLVASYASLVGTAGGTRYYLGRPDPEIFPEGADPFVYRDAFLETCGILRCTSVDDFSRAIANAVRSMSPGMRVTQRPNPRISLKGVPRDWTSKSPLPVIT